MYITKSKDDKSIKICWKTMHNRINHPANEEVYAKSKGKGIKVHKCWCGVVGFNNFLKWAKENGYKKGLFLDRIDNSKGYYPKNCRFVTFAESNRNRTNTRTVIDPRTGDKAYFLDIYHEKPRTISYDAAYRRFKRGQSLEKCFR